MGGEISSALRTLVAERARYRCEYCLLHDEDSFTPHQIDHITSRKHGGATSAENLAYSCIRCNAWKGSDIAAFGFNEDSIVPLFHPRRNRWIEHFQLKSGEIVPLTSNGAATVRLLRLNLHGRIAERRTLAACGRYPRD